MKLYDEGLKRERRGEDIDLHVGAFEPFGKWNDECFAQTLAAMAEDEKYMASRAGCSGQVSGPMQV